MDPATQQKLNELCTDYQAVVGHPFLHFYCPLLFQDDETVLCRAHIVNKAFADSARAWTVQRADVDNFYGRMFEGEFVNIQYWRKQSPDEAIADPVLSKKLRPAIFLGGRAVQHFVARGPVPEDFTEAVTSDKIRLGLKIHPIEAVKAISEGCQVQIAQDVRLPALVSLLKAAHLTLFQLLGYRYALSAGGHFLGKTVLGDFYIQNHVLSKGDVLKNAAAHFGKFANLVRPVLASPVELQGTVTDHFLFVCSCDAQTPWALIVFVRTSDRLHAVLVPVLESESAAVRFAEFLQSDGGRIRANRCHFEEDTWKQSRQSEMLVWPKAELL